MSRRATRCGLCGMLLLSCSSRGCEQQEEAPAEVVAPLSQLPQPQSPSLRAPRELSDALRELRDYRAVEFRAPSDVEAESYRQWLSSSTSRGWAGSLPRSAPPEGFGARWLDAGRLWLFSEQVGQKRGAGAVVARPDFGANLVIEVPHSYFDSATLPIGIELFRATSARALLVNTYHRGGPGSAEERKELALSGESPYDVAHAPRTYFSTAHRALLGAAPDALVLQLHGFSNSSAEGVDAIVSGADAGFDVGELTRELARAFPDFVVKRYPDEVDVLGGTTNVQAAISSGTDARFVHLELSYRFRNRLSEDPGLAGRMIQPLRRIAGGG